MEGSLRILVAEDQPRPLRTVADMLGDAGSIAVERLAHGDAVDARVVGHLREGKCRRRLVTRHAAGAATRPAYARRDADPTRSDLTVVIRW